MIPLQYGQRMPIGVTGEFLGVTLLGLAAGMAVTFP